MRKVIFGINLSIDGCCDHTKLSGNDDIYEYLINQYRDTDLFVFGRKTYQLMFPFWPDVARDRSGKTKAMNEFAQAFAAVETVVFSQSLDRAEGKNTRIVRTRPQDEILKLKQEQGKNIWIGGLNLLSQLVGSGLIDEYHFIVQPIVVGEGRRLLEGISLQEKLQLKLVDSMVFTSGCVALRYLKQ
ncbi:MAG TPA: dihydrofolate reductase family protein [Puia sp.]|jgi:dihydrofolate reductase|nr:dihydrofolate reductase family protein [Puia sp.]